MSGEHTGWIREAEDDSFLKELAKSALPKEFRTYGVPSEVRPDIGANAHRLENQGPMGSCQGHTIASCVEQLNTTATSGDRTQLSNLFAYLATQKIDGLLGSDRGSTISGGVKLATSSGVPPLANAPYPNPVRYPNGNQIRSILKQANYDAGKPFTIRSSIGIRSHDQAKQWIGGGGVISIGKTWPPRFRTVNQRRVVSAIGQRGGGHAVAILGYRKNGNLIVANSHDYWYEIPPQLFEQTLRHRYTVCIGLSDMANPKPRDLSYLKTKLANWSGNIKSILEAT